MTLSPLHAPGMAPAAPAALVALVAPPGGTLPQATGRRQHILTGLIQGGPPVFEGDGLKAPYASTGAAGPGC
jgi:hypothetical protein